MLNRLSLKQVLVSFIGAVLAVLVVALSLLSYTTFKDFNFKEAVKFRHQQGISVSHQVDTFVAGVQDRLEMVSAAVQYNGYSITNEKAIVELLNQVHIARKASATYIVFEDGTSLEHTGEKLSDLNTDRSWFTEPKSGLPFAISKPSVDQLTGKLLTSLSVPLVVNDQFIGVVGIDISSDVWQQMISSNVSDGQVFLTDNNNTVLYSPYDGHLGKDFFDIRPMYKAFSGSYLEYKLSDGTQFVGVKNGPTNSGLMIYLFEKNNVILAPSENMLMTLLWSALVLIVISLFAVFAIIIKLIYVPIGGEPKEIERVIARIAEGDLTVEVPENAKASGIYAATIIMHKNLKSLVGGLNAQSRQVEETSNELVSLVEETKQSSDKQILQMEMTSTAMNEMVSTVEEISRNAQQASNSADSAYEQASNGAVVTNKTSEVMNALGRDIDTVSQTITELKEETEKVGSVLEVITSIAEQTNLLALNAAIEAARAGEQGRGFAVVADEVRNLASRTQKSIEEINTTIDKLQQVASSAVDSMGMSHKNTGDAISLAREASESLMSILDSVRDIQDINNQIATAAEEQNAVAREINQSVIEVNGLAIATNENAQGTEKSTNKLSTVVLKLSEISDQFTV